jgi:hypothetical protein
MPRAKKPGNVVTVVPSGPKLLGTVVPGGTSGIAPRPVTGSKAVNEGMPKSNLFWKKGETA